MLESLQDLLLRVQVFTVFQDFSVGSSGPALYHTLVKETKRGPRLRVPVVCVLGLGGGSAGAALHYSLILTPKKTQNKYCNTCVCIYIYVYVCMYIISMHACMHECMHGCMYVYQNSPPLLPTALQGYGVALPLPKPHLAFISCAATSGTMLTRGSPGLEVSSEEYFFLIFRPQMLAKGSTASGFAPRT